MKLKLIISTTILLTSLFTIAAAEKWTVPEETVTYDVMYKWGLINK